MVRTVRRATPEASTIRAAVRSETQTSLQAKFHSLVLPHRHLVLVVGLSGKLHSLDQRALELGAGDHLLRAVLAPISPVRFEPVVSVDYVEVSAPVPDGDGVHRLAT
jgi:hypothetical protein